MNKNILKYELRVENQKEAINKCLEIIFNVQNVLDIKGLEYIKTFLINLESEDK